MEYINNKNNKNNDLKAGKRVYSITGISIIAHIGQSLVK